MDYRAFAQKSLCDRQGPSSIREHNFFHSFANRFNSTQDFLLHSAFCKSRKLFNVLKRDIWNQTSLILHIPQQPRNIRKNDQLVDLQRRQPVWPRPGRHPR